MQIVVEMTTEEAIEYSKKNGGKLLVAVSNLEDEKNLSSKFISKDIYECERIINEAETIARVYDDFVNQLRCYTKKQIDIMNIHPYGKLSTILLKE